MSAPPLRYPMSYEDYLAHPWETTIAEWKEGEVISDDSVGRDRGDKFDEYEDAGVPEYWIIDPRPRQQRMEAYAMDGKGRYQPIPVGRDGILASRVLPGFWIKQDWLWEEVSPSIMPLLAEILGLPSNVLDSFKP